MKSHSENISPQKPQNKSMESEKKDFDFNESKNLNESRLSEGKHI